MNSEGGTASLPRFAAAPYSSSPVIQGISFNRSSHDRQAPGSDNWPVTWGDDGHQYTSWGDGGGFGGTNSDSRVSLGVGQVRGDWDSYRGSNIWGGKNPQSRATFGGKSYGIISIDSDLYMWVSPGSGTNNYNEARLYHSTNHGESWKAASWRFTKSEDLVMPTILQFGRDYAGGGDFVYHYFIQLQNGNSLAVQKPGRVYLLRVHKNDIFANKSDYEYFNGLNSSGDPIWSGDISNKKPVFEDRNGVGWNLAVSYNAGLGRYLLTTEHSESDAGNLGIFDAPTPWGPWTTVEYYSNWQGFDTTFFWNFANKWVSSDGRDFTLVFTGTKANDSWNTIRGRFTLASNLPAPTPAPTPDPVVTHSLPGHLEAENYKSGGEGVGYHDTTPGNTGGEFRSEDVDIQVSTDVDGGFNVGWIDPGEWLAFQVKVAQTAPYDLTARVASAQAGDKTLHVELDGVDVTGPMTFTDASGWQSWQDVSVPAVSLPAGEHELRIVMDSDSLNLNYLSVIPAPGTATRLPVPGRIEAEGYKGGGEGVGYHDTTPGNTGGELRSEDVDIQASTDAGGGHNVGWIDPGEWLAYDIAVSESQGYDLVARVASAVAGVKSLRVEVDGVDVSGLMSFSDAAGWQSWVDVVVTGVNLAAGEHELRLVMTADSFNLNYLDVIPSGNQAPAAAIASPGNGASFLSVDAISFNGSATDPEDGGLAAGSLVWTSNLDGEIGTGGSAQAALSAGEHVVTLTATDSQGLRGSAAVTITVTELVYGDANGDGAFTGDDIYLAVDWVIGRQPMPQAGTPSFVAADVNGDGSVDASDIILMIDRLSGTLSQFPVEP